MRKRFLLMAIGLILMGLGILFSIANAKSNAFYTLLDSVTAPGPGNPVTIREGVFKLFEVQVEVTGSPTQVEVAIEGNIRGNKFRELARYQFDQDDLTEGQANFTIVNHAPKQIRANLISLSGGTNPTVTVVVRGVK